MNPIRPIPNGLCHDDCGQQASPGSFFLPGHDKRAERYLTSVQGATSIADRLWQQGFVPGSGRSLRDAALEADATLEECGRLSRALVGLPCRIIGSGRGIAVHRADDSQHLLDDEA